MKPTILQGDVRETLKSLPDNSVHCVVTSPPYWALRSYLPKGHHLKPLEIGSEPTPEAFIATMVGVFREVRRVLHPSGTCWVNIGDSYAGGGGFCATAPSTATSKSGRYGTAGAEMKSPGNVPGLKPKDLCLIPERLAIALQSDGWWVRSRIAWCKKSSMPESVTDRPTSAWEHIWLLTKSARYFYDATAVRQPAQSDHPSGNGFVGRQGGAGYQSKSGGQGTVEQWDGVGGQANLRNFWLLGPESYSGAHFATYPTEIPRRAILAGTSARGCCPKCLAPWERVVETRLVKTRNVWNAKGGNVKQEGVAAKNRGADGHVPGYNETRTTGWCPTCECDAGDPQPCTVLDPFGGSGTTAAVAIELGRKAILCELNPNYIPLIEQRTLVTAGLQLA